MVDLDPSVVFAALDKENAQPTYKGGVRFCPNLATCDNTDDVLVIDPRPGGATSNCAGDNIALLDLAVSRLPGRYRRRVLVRLDGAPWSASVVYWDPARGRTIPQFAPRLMPCTTQMIKIEKVLADKRGGAGGTRTHDLTDYESAALTS